MAKKSSRKEGGSEEARTGKGGASYHQAVDEGRCSQVESPFKGADAGRENIEGNETHGRRSTPPRWHPRNWARRAALTKNSSRVDEFASKRPLASRCELTARRQTLGLPAAVRVNSVGTQIPHMNSIDERDPFKDPNAVAAYAEESARNVRG